MKKLQLAPLVFVPMAILFAGCNLPAREAAEDTATLPPVPTLAPTNTPRPTNTPSPTNTPRPTNTPEPTPTPAPTWEPVAMADIEAALRLGGYRRFPFTTDNGVAGFFWTRDNPYERVRTWEDGTIELQVLHEKSASARAERMERHLAILDTVLPPGFMDELRQEHAAYNPSLGSSVTGDADGIYAYEDEWQTVWAEYNASGMGIGGYGVRFSLWWWQSTCPPQYDYCYYSDFPGLEFTGDSSFVFHTILIWLPEEGGLPGGSA